jgi:hypothetical protein
MEQEKTIRIPSHNIEINLVDPDPEKEGLWLGGSISSDLKEICPHCNDPKCEMDCPQFGEYCTDRDTDIVAQKEKERIDFQRHRAAIDALESLILGHACAGIDVESPAYLEGIDTALNAITNNL